MDDSGEAGNGGNRAMKLTSGKIPSKKSFARAQRHLQVIRLVKRLRNRPLETFRSPVNFCCTDCIEAFTLYVHGAFGYRERIRA